MAPIKIKDERAALVLQFLVFVVSMFAIDLLISDDSVMSALFLSVSTGILALGCMWWLTRRARN